MKPKILSDLNQAKPYLAQTVLNQTQGVMPPGMIHDDVLNTQRLAPPDEGQSIHKNGIFEFMQSGITMIRRIAQDDYRYQQLNEIIIHSKNSEQVFKNEKRFWI